MSKQHTGVYSPEEIEELRTRYSNEKVDAMVEEAKAVAEQDSEDLLGPAEDSSVDYDRLNKPELTKLLEERGLDTSGTNKEQADRLREDDAKGE